MRVRVGLRFGTKESPVGGTSLLADGKEVGLVTRAAFSPTIEEAIGMGYVRREYSALGTALDCNLAKAEVIQLPIGAPSNS